MIGLGTLINTAAIAMGGLAGHFFGKRLTQRYQTSLIMACGVGTLCIGISGAMQGMLIVDNGTITAARATLTTICLALGTLIGEAIDIETRFETFGEWLKRKTKNEKDDAFVNAFVTASLTVCIGAMAIVGAIQDGVSGDWSVLATKAMLDFIIIMVMTCSLGKGCAFSAIPVFLFEGAVTAAASLLRTAMTDAALEYLSMIGSILIFCVGINLVWGKKIRVANMLPSVIVAVIAAYIHI